MGIGELTQVVGVHVRIVRADADVLDLLLVLLLLLLVVVRRHGGILVVGPMVMMMMVVVVCACSCSKRRVDGADVMCWGSCGGHYCVLGFLKVLSYVVVVVVRRRR